MPESLIVRLARDVAIAPKQAEAAVELLDSGSTVPLIARYRKEATNSLDAVQLRYLDERGAIFTVNRVENLSLESKRVAFNTKLQIDYSSDVDRARAVMVAAAQAQPRVLKDPAPNAMLTDIAPDGLELTLGYWIADPENGINNVRSEINLAIWKAFQAEGISVPFPQRVVRVVNEAAAAA